MKVFYTMAAFRAWRDATDGHVGFAPTMGNLHAGHIGCLEAVQALAATSVVSIFVNPTQFAPTDDFAKYPRTLDNDLKLLEASGCDAVFVPSIEEMYPAGASTKVLAGTMASGLEGAFRPGHFDGVATVCLKLFQIIQPDVVALGCKDLQQLRVIEQLVCDLNMPLKIHAVPTFRDENHLALSSRNRYLTPDGKAQASQLYSALRQTLRLVSEGTTPEYAEASTTTLLEQQGWQVDYMAVRDAITFQSITPESVSLAVLGAARLNGVRLIDNITATMD